MDYSKKYEKYKNKYLNLKKLIGGEKYSIVPIEPDKLNELKDKWLVIREKYTDGIHICKFLKSVYKNLTPEIEEFGHGSEKTTYTFEDIKCKTFILEKTRGMSDAGGSINETVIFLIENLNSERDKINSEEIIKELNFKFPIKTTDYNNYYNPDNPEEFINDIDYDDPW